jgi:hypothetical protein
MKGKFMNASLLTPPLQEVSLDPTQIQQKVNGIIDELMASLPEPQQMTSEERRGMIARYTAVLEGNFIYWMTACLLSVKAEDAKPILLDNLNEEIRDAHPVMLRNFAIAAHAFPTDADALAVNDDLNKVRRFLGRLSGVQTVLTMGFFESFIQKFMDPLAKLAITQGSTDMEYTDVHGVCDIAHSQGLFMALSAEMALNPMAPDADLYEGVHLLRNLIKTIINGGADKAAA